MCFNDVTCFFYYRKGPLFKLYKIILTYRYIVSSILQNKTSSNWQNLIQICINLSSLQTVFLIMAQTFNARNKRTRVFF